MKILLVGGNDLDKFHYEDIIWGNDLDKFHYEDVWGNDLDKFHYHYFIIKGETIQSHHVM